MRKAALPAVARDLLGAKDGCGPLRARGTLLVMALALFAATLPGARPALAADFVVTSTDDSGPGTLREAVGNANAAAGPDTITFAPALAGQTIDLSTAGDSSLGASALAVTSETTIEGPTGNDGVTIARADSAPNMRLFLVTQSGDLTLRNLTLSGGLARGGNGGSIGNAGGGAAGLGGAVVNEGALTIEASTLTGNQAVGGNGGNGDGNGCAGGGGGLGGNGGGGCVFNSGGGPNGGGAGSFSSGGGNGGFGGGGGSGISHGGTGGFGGGGGGGFEAPGGNGGFGGGGGSSDNGGGSGGFGGGNSGPNDRGGGGGGGGLGGAVFSNGGTVTVTNSTLSANTAQGGVGGSGFGGSGGSGQGLGGGIFNRNGTVTVLNSTFANNTANQGGGGIYNLGDGATGTATLDNTIAGDANNGATDFQSNTINGGTSTTGGTNNLIENGSGFDGSSNNADPKLDPLADNGGPTETHALQPESPAIESGKPSGLTTDQRGQQRPHDDPYTGNATGGDGTDVGAFEAQTDAAPPDLSIDDVKVKEGNSATRNATFTVTLSKAVEVPVTVNYATSNGTARAGSDYLATSGTLTLDPGQTSKTLAVAIKGDRKKEKHETYFVNLSAAEDASIADGQGEGTILNNDRRRR